ncbi:MAG: penicillin-binding transpeptidase domain-containing protein [Longimicrobiales bacterium]
MRKRAADPTHGLALRRQLVLGGLLAGSLLLSVRAFRLQVLQAEAWRERAQHQQGNQVALPAPRGGIYDRDGVPLAVSQEVFRVNIAAREVKDRAHLSKLLQKHLKLTRAAAQRAVNPKRAWVVLPGQYNAATRKALNGVRGVYFERDLRRFHPRGEIANELLGAVSMDHRALGGLELEFDSVLRGRAGRAVTRRDVNRKSIPGAWLEVSEPVAGHDLHLTLDADLQEIAREALADALAETRAASGEIVMADPRTGEVLAAVSSKAGARSWRAVTEPYEPGSTLKPFAVATLLAEKRAQLSDSVFGENGEYTHQGRTIKDVHAYGWLTLAEALKHSSNVVLAKMSERLDAQTQYAYLRAFGFGSPTAITYPSEASGLLRRPAQWTRYSQASLAIGYEISVTPLQMLMAYGALANGGLLMEPRLVREVRTRDGRTTRALPAQSVRRVIPERVAHQLRGVLTDAVEAGTAQAAALGRFAVAGKTGTTRAFAAGRYRSGAYFSTFAGFFPADDPQLVFLVKLDSPRGAYYGGLTAAPVTRATLEAALAALSTPLDKRAMATAPPPPLRVMPVKASDPGERASGAFIFVLDAGPLRRALTTDAQIASVPDVSGLPLRDAVRRLHASGFSVRVQGRGVITGSAPVGGTPLRRGAVVRLSAAEVRS